MNEWSPVRMASQIAEPVDGYATESGPSMAYLRCGMDPASAESRFAVSRRTLLAGAAATTSAGIAGYVAGATGGAKQTRAPLSDSVPFFGAHQAGITTPAQAALAFAAFDFTGGSPDDLRTLLQDWSRDAEAMCRGQAVGRAEPSDPPVDTGEADGLRPANLTITFGLGPSLFERAELSALPRPAGLHSLPPFRGDALDPTRSDGDLGVQACADDPQVAFHAIHQLAQRGRGLATLRWYQQGFNRATAVGDGQATPRALIGFKDGTNNIRSADVQAQQRHVWIGRNNSAPWLVGGTYMVTRRIRFLFDVWDSTSLRGQEAVIGREKASGAPLGGAHEHSAVRLGARIDGAPAIPLNAHIRLAAPANNGGVRILRRGYSFADGVDQQTGGLDAGLFFISFQRSVENFSRIQHVLSQHDALAKHVLHVGSAVFICPPGARESGFVGETLFG